MSSIVFVCLMILFAHCRHYQTSIKLLDISLNEGWIFIDKMTFAPGRGKVTFMTQIEGIPTEKKDGQIFFVGVPQNRWQAEELKKCKNPSRMPIAVHQISTNGSETFSSFHFGTQDYQTYYFILKDCYNHLKHLYNDDKLTMHIKLHLLNNDGEMGEEEDHWYIVPFIVIAGFFIVLQYQKKKEFNEKDNWVKMMLFAGTATQVSSLIWKTFGFLIFAYTGQDYFFFHFIYLLMHSTSQSAMTSLFILIACGWTLTFYKDKKLQILFPIAFLFGIINVIITLLTKLGHSHDRHHIFDSVGGNVLIGMRCGLALLFLIAWYFTFRQVRHNLKQFLYKFLILGLIYIISLPLVVVLANNWFQPKNRNEFVFITIQIIKFMTNALTAYEFNKVDSHYNRINYKNASFLPEQQKGFK